MMCAIDSDLLEVLCQNGVPDRFNQWLLSLKPPVTSLIHFANLSNSRANVNDMATLAGFGKNEFSVIGALKMAWISANAQLELMTDIKSGKIV